MQNKGKNLLYKNNDIIINKHKRNNEKIFDNIILIKSFRIIIPFI